MKPLLSSRLVRELKPCSSRARRTFDVLPRSSGDAVCLRIRRSFHATASRPLPLSGLETVIAGSHEFLLSIHTLTGLSWALCLPLTAVVLRTALLYPQLYSRRVAQKRLLLQPILQSWLAVKRKEIALVATGPAEATKTLRNEIKLLERRLYKRHGCQTWKLYLPFMCQAPAFVAVIDSLRRMSGSPDGLLHMMLRFGESATAATTTSLVPFEASMETEGALWFQNLAAMDYTFALPILLSGTFYAMVSLNAHSRTRIGPPTLFQKRVARIMTMVAFAIGPIMYPMPSAILVYWISHLVCSMTISRAMDAWRPLVVPVKKCRPTTALDLTPHV